jgi:hypothetical protein
MTEAISLLPLYVFVAWKGKLQRFQIQRRIRRIPPSPDPLILHVALSFSMSVLPRVTTREPLFMKFGTGALTAICLLVLVLVRIGQEQCTLHQYLRPVYNFFFARRKAFGA